MATETSLFLVFMAAALVVGMAVYLQRGIQGGIYQTASGLGNQFDPGSGFQEQRQMSFTQKATTLVEPDPTPIPCVIQPDGSLLCPPGPGPIAIPPFKTTTTFEASWSITRDPSGNFYHVVE